MKKKLSVLLLALALVVCSLMPRAKVAAQVRRGRRAVGGGAAPSRALSSSAITARFEKIADTYLRGYYAFNPTRATQLGLHDYDRELESRSREAVASEVRRLRGTLNELARIWENGLTPEARADYQIIASHARGQLLELEDVRGWQRDPNIYNHLAAESVDFILKRNYAPVEERLDAVLVREREMARLFSEARANLENPPRIYTEMAITDTRGSVDFFTRVVPQLFERAGGGRLSASRKAEFEASNQNAIAALRAYADWLERELLPRSAGDFSIGAENLRRKLLDDEMIDAPIGGLLSDGERELRRTQEEMRAVAEEIAPGRGIIYALRSLERERPTVDGLVGEARNDVDRLRAFVRTQNILTPPAERENLIVALTPEYARSINFAQMDAVGPFESVASESFFYVTPPAAELNGDGQDEHLRFYNRFALPLLSMREVAPGHYYQMLALRKQPSRVRSALESKSFVEGWAEYCEGMMLDEGFGGNNPKLRLAQLSLALQSLCRYVVSLRMHTQGMAFEQAVEFFVREGYMARVNAERETRRATVEPTTFVGTLGKLEILKLRDEWKGRMGASFSLGDFHDRLLSFGMSPLKIVRQAMLGEARSGNVASMGNVSATGNLSSTSSNNSQEQSSRVDFSVLATGTYSTYEGGRITVLVTSQEEWLAEWQLIGNERPLPDINFNTRAVVIAFQGRKPTGGYSIGIEEIRRYGNAFVVRAHEQSPTPRDFNAQALTSPFVAVTIPRPPAGASINYEADVKKAEQNRQEKRPVLRPRGRASVRRARNRP
jgi:hypothetical protein